MACSNVFPVLSPAGCASPSSCFAILGGQFRLRLWPGSGSPALTAPLLAEKWVASPEDPQGPVPLSLPLSVSRLPSCILCCHHLGHEHLTVILLKILRVGSQAAAFMETSLISQPKLPLYPLTVLCLFLPLLFCF